MSPRFGAFGCSVNLTLVKTKEAKLEKAIAIHSSKEASRNVLTSGCSNFEKEMIITNARSKGAYRRENSKIAFSI